MSAKWKLEKADITDLDLIHEIVQTTINMVYPKYYPAEVVRFFSNHHCKNSIRKDLEVK